MNIIRLNTTAPDGFVKGGNGNGGNTGNSYFYEIPIDLLKKIDDAEEPLTIKEAIELHTAADIHYKCVARFDKFLEGGIPKFWGILDYSESFDAQSEENPRGMVKLVLGEVYWLYTEGGLTSNFGLGVSLRLEDGVFVFD